MANKEQTRLERDIAIIEQTLRAMIEIDSTLAQCLQMTRSRVPTTPP